MTDVLKYTKEGDDDEIWVQHVNIDNLNADYQGNIALGNVAGQSHFLIRGQNPDID